jgi:hypothetical protein
LTNQDQFGKNINEMLKLKINDAMKKAIERNKDLARKKSLS